MDFSISRVRSRTMDAAEVKKNGLPRRLNEKIALMKKKELAQSQAFEQAMQSIFEMQQAQLHSGGGSMPSLQNIDAVPTNPLQPQSIAQFPSYLLTDTPSVYTTTPPTGNKRERPLSSGTTGRTIGVERALSCDVQGLSHQPVTDNTQWNIHKSEPDLPQTIFDHMSALQTPPFIHSQSPPTNMRSSHNNYHAHHSPEQSSMTRLVDHNGTWGSTHQHYTNSTGMPVHGSICSGSVSAVLLSPEHHGGSGMVSNIDSAHIGSASSLPDLTNFEFSSGLDVPIERDDDSPTYNKNKLTSFHYPPSSPGPSKLVLSSVMATNPASSPPSLPRVEKTLDFRPHPYLHQPHPHVSMGRPASPTMPSHTQLSAPPVRKFKSPIVSKYSHGYQTPPTHNDSFMSMLSPPTDSYDQIHSSHQNTSFTNTAPYVNSVIHSPNESRHNQGFNNGTGAGVVSPGSASFQPSFQTEFNTNVMIPPTMQIDDSMLMGVSQSHHLPQQLPNSPAKPPSLASTTSSGYVSLSSYLDPATVNYQQRAIQQKLASISMCKDNPPLRSHSEENLIKMQKELSRNENIMQQNPFMGNMSNASSVPCVYVETNSVEPCVDEIESYTTGTGSPSTSVSHGSSPPLVRPDWIEHPHAMNDFVFQDWPLEAGGAGSLLAADKVKFGSPLAHHKSLTELNKLGNDCFSMDLSPNPSNRAHQLSLPSIVMGDLIAMDELGLVEKQGSGPFFPSDFDMEEEVMDSLLRNEDLVPFDVTTDGSVVLNATDLYANNMMR